MVGEEVPMTPGRRRSYGIALFIRPEATVSEVHEILDELADADVHMDYSTAEFAAEGLLFEAETDGEDVLEDVERIGAEHHGLLKVDWDAMSDWATEGAERSTTSSPGTSAGRPETPATSGRCAGDATTWPTGAARRRGRWPTSTRLVWRPGDEQST